VPDSAALSASVALLVSHADTSTSTAMLAMAYFQFFIPTSLA
jgi:hypothetical protein